MNPRLPDLPAGRIRSLKTSVVMSLCLLVLLWRAYNHLLAFQLDNPPLIWVGNNLAGALYKYYGVYRWLVVSQTGAFLFTCLLLGAALAAIVRPLSRSSAFLFAASLTIYTVLSSAHMGHNAHFLSMLVVFSLVFLPRSHVSFGLLWEGMRYYVCWLYVSAIYWRVLKGGAFQPDFGLLIFKGNLVDYLLLNSETPRAHLSYFFLQHPALLRIGAKIVFLVEGLFAVGFFTKKYDLLLLAFSLFIPVCTFLFADTFFFESLPASLVFVPESCWHRLAAFVWPTPAGVQPLPGSMTDRT